MSFDLEHFVVEIVAEKPVSGEVSVLVKIPIFYFSKKPKNIMYSS